MLVLHKFIKMIYHPESMFLDISTSLLLSGIQGMYTSNQNTVVILKSVELVLFAVKSGDGVSFEPVSS